VGQNNQGVEDRRLQVPRVHPRARRRRQRGGVRPRRDDVFGVGGRHGEGVAAGGPGEGAEAHGGENAAEAGVCGDGAGGGCGCFDGVLRRLRRARQLLGAREGLRARRRPQGPQARRAVPHRLGDVSVQRVRRQDYMRVEKRRFDSHVRVGSHGSRRSREVPRRGGGPRVRRRQRAALDFVQWQFGQIR